MVELPNESKVMQESYYNIGRKEGWAFAQSASYEELLYVASRYGTALEKEEGQHDLALADLEIGDYFQMILNEYNDPNLCYYEGVPSPMLAAWEQGWKDAVVAFYEEIKEKLL
jgi:hypothetical protein